ncbi:hypothetical protein Tco_1443458, partial [Tanacetum coccineum]
MSLASTVTYTSVYTDSEPGRVFWRANEELSDGGSPRVIVYGYDGLPMQPVAPPSPDYVPGPEHPPSPDYVPAPEHPPSPVEPLPANALPTALSPGYVAYSDPEEYPKEDHADYPADGGDDDDEPSDDDDDDTDDEDEEPFEDEDEEEEHLALVDTSTITLFPQLGIQRHLRLIKARIAEYAAAPTPPSPLSPWSPPLPQIPSSPLPPLPVSLFIPPPVDRREDIPEAELPPRKRLCLTALTSRYEVGESSTAAPRPTGGHRADYRDVWVDLTEAVEEVAPATLDGVNARVTELAAVQEQGTQDIYVVIEDGQDRQTQLFQRVDGLVEDGQFHYETARLLDREAHVSREAWAHSVGLSSAVSSLQGQMSVALGQIQALQAGDQAHADDPEGAASTNNMPPRRSTAATRAAAAAATPMTAAAVEQLIEARVSAALANHETLRNITNGHGDGSHNSDTR